MTTCTNHTYDRFATKHASMKIHMAGSAPTDADGALIGPARRYRYPALVVASKPARQRFRELVGTELADTVTSTEDVAAELQTPHDVLRKLPG